MKAIRNRRDTHIAQMCAAKPRTYKRDDALWLGR